METRTLAPSQTLGFGMYADQTAAWVANNNPGYLRYLEKNGLKIEISPPPAQVHTVSHDQEFYSDDHGDPVYPGDDDPNGDEEFFWRSVIGQ